MQIEHDRLLVRFNRRDLPNGHHDVGITRSGHVARIVNDGFGREGPIARVYAKCDGAIVRPRQRWWWIYELFVVAQYPRRVGGVFLELRPVGTLDVGCGEQWE